MESGAKADDYGPATRRAKELQAVGGYAGGLLSEGMGRLSTGSQTALINSS